MTLKTVCKIGEAICLAGKAAVCFLDLLTVTEDKEMPKKQKIFRIFTDVFVIATHTASVGACAVRAHPNTRLALSGASATAEVAQRVVLLSGKKEPIGLGDCLDLGAGALLRVSCLVNDAIVFKPEFFGPHKEAVETAANVANIVSTVVGNRDLLVNSWDFVGRLVKRFRGLPMVAVAPNQGMGRPYINLAPENAEAIYRLQRMQTINEIEEIPSLFYNDPVFERFRCAFSGIPIRHLLVVAGTEDRTRPIWFESRAILQKIQEGARPAQWPQDVAFTRENLREFPVIQGQIDKLLTDLLEDIHNADLRFEPLENFAHSESQKILQIVAILKAIGLERINDMQDAEICDAVVAKVSPNTIANVCVNTIWHRFHAGMELKRTKVIRFTPTVTLMKKPPLSKQELFAATRAAVLSQDSSDKKALLLAQTPFEIRVSTDLEDLTICSDLVRFKYERKEELLYMMKSALQAEHLQAFSDEELADRIIQTMTRKNPIVNVSVRSLSYQFAGTSELKPARSIAFSPPIKETGGKACSAKSLFAAARSIFGSQGEIDMQELKKCRPFIVYVDMDFQDIDIKEIL